MGLPAFSLDQSLGVDSGLHRADANRQNLNLSWMTPQEAEQSALESVLRNQS